jgi:PadR family transcriptional regulator, regulatory protein PadR
MPPKSDVLLGTLDMLILRTLTLGALHGYAIAQHIAKSSDDVLQVEQGKWAESPTKRQARYYTITASGRKQLKEKTSDYDRVALAIAQVMGRA